LRFIREPFDANVYSRPKTPLLKPIVFFITASILFLQGCDIINPKEKEPAYLYIPSFTFQSNLNQGTSSEAITEVWVYADDQSLGVFDLPAKIPILDLGTSNIRVFAGIKNNGISNTRIRYPFYAPFDTTLTISAFEIDTLVPHFTYYNQVVISEKGFESGNFLVQAGTNNGTFSVTNQANQVFEGNRSGWGHIDAGLSHLYYKDDENLFYQSGNNVFLEMNYSSNNTFSVGFITTTGGIASKNVALIINPSSSGDGLAPVWKKIYIDFGYVLQQNPTAQFHELYIESIPANATTPVNIFIDNLKWVTW
jgi:hypothetical protein